MAFAGGMTVFPGGGVDPRDGEADLAWQGPAARWWAERFGAGERAWLETLVTRAWWDKAPARLRKAHGPRP